jgi:hypothetical protein
MMPWRRAAPALPRRPRFSLAGRPASLAAGIQARYTAISPQARRTARVLRRSAASYVLSLRGHHEHVHVHPVLHRHTLIRVTHPAPPVWPAPARPGPMRAPSAPWPGWPALARPAGRTVPRRNRSAPAAVPPPLRTARHLEARTVRPSPRRPGTQAALTLASRFAARIAPATAAPGVVRRADPPPPPAATSPAVNAPAEARPDRAPRTDPVVTTAQGVSQAPGVDLDAVTGEVLRRIERRAVAQRERLGRGPF